MAKINGVPYNTSTEYVLHALRAIRYRATSLLGRLMLHGLDVRFGPGLVLKGLPIVTCAPGSSIVLGSQVTLISLASDTALGVNHAVKLETVAEGASIVIGDQVGISGGSICAQVSIRIGARSMLGANVIVVDTDFHPLAASHRWLASDDIQASPVVIGENVFLGANVMVLRGVHIGDNAVIGAGSVVTKDVPSNAVAAGNPCRVLRYFSEAEIAKMDIGTPNR